MNDINDDIRTEALKNLAENMVRLKMQLPLKFTSRFNDLMKKKFDSRPVSSNG